MAAYAQSGTKRQKVRERVDNVDYFQGIEKIEYNNTASHTDTNCYRYYSNTERLHSRSMEEWLKFSVSFTDFRRWDSNLKQNRQWDDGTDTTENRKRSIKALFEFMLKINVKYWTAFDSDLVPWNDSFEEYKQCWDDMVEFVQEFTQRHHVKLLWLAPDLHTNARYSSGAMTSHEASTFMQASYQSKKCMEMAQKLNAECFLIWPVREGYYEYVQADVQREIKLFAKLMKMVGEYRDRLNFRCQLLIMPYYGGNRQYEIRYHQWDGVINHYLWDVTSCLYFLKNYNLDRLYKVCSAPGHNMLMAHVYNMLGGVSVGNDGFHYDNRTLALMMKCIVDQGCAPPGGINLKLVQRRDGDLRDLVALYVEYIDSVARGLRVAVGIIGEQIFSKYLQQSYGSYCSGLGSRLTTGEVSMEECEEYYKKNQNSEACRKCEHFDVVFQRYVDAYESI